MQLLSTTAGFFVSLGPFSSATIIFCSNNHLHKFTTITIQMTEYNNAKRKLYSASSKTFDQISSQNLLYVLYSVCVMMSQQVSV